MSLRNTEYIYGVVVFTGHDTKVMMNSAKAKMKFSKLQNYLSYSIFLIFCVQFVLALLGGAFGFAWLSTYGCVGQRGDICEEKVNYLPNETHIGWFSFIRITGTWILMFTNMIPISLMVTCEVVNFW